jgi:glycosyltransferase involved in cell wall biosynthesis
MKGHVFDVPTLFTGRPQRHLYLVNPVSILKRLRPATLFIEAEPHSVSALQWGAAAQSLRIPFGVQAAENLERPLPAPVVRYRTWVLQRARFVVARSATAAQRAHEWGARGEVVVLPHAIPEWKVSRVPSKVFTVGFAGRLVPEKGVRDLVESFHHMKSPAELVFFGDGPLKSEIEQSSPNVTVVANLTHEQMAEAYASIDLLVLPSRSTPTWQEQFGRVLVEALSCGVPVVGSTSGEIPWVISTTGGGQVFPEGDVAALAALLDQFAVDPEQRGRFARQGGEVVARMFSTPAVAKKLGDLLSAI